MDYEDGYLRGAYGGEYQDWAEFDDDHELDGRARSGDDPDNEDDFNILDDIDTVLFFRVNSFVHSVTGSELQDHSFEAMEHGVNETPAKLANDERTEYASSKINFYFHKLMALLEPAQVTMVQKVHRTLNQDIGTVLDYFHKRTC
mmetsp:Transcript_25744/g.34402  ORF Transcript_25744/g.34402 Transcript_25744/m.34402 type:complete len:145 (-) Transcript_25744:914-1348(-)